jgi:hypothetical protein
LIAATEAESDVPWYAFVLAGLPPITVGVMALPSIAKLSGVGKHLVFWTLCLGPTIAAVILAMRAETLPTTNEELSLVPAIRPC